MKYILSISAMFLALFFTNCNAGNSNKESSKSKENATSEVKSTTSNTMVVHITNEEFKAKVFDYTKHKEWVYEGDKPCILDFYATWCGPCKMIAPFLDELSVQYAGKIIVYKIDTDEERDLAQAMGIQALPTLVFVPMKGKPHASQGAVSKQELDKTINEILLTK